MRISSVLPERLLNQVSALASHLALEIKEFSVSGDPISATDWSLANGTAGHALAYEWMDRCYPNNGWEICAKSSMSQCVKRMGLNRDLPLSLGLMNGIGGVALVAALMSRNGKRYTQLTAGLHSTIKNHSSGVRRSHTHQSAGELLTADFDLVSGATGLAAYGLTAEDANLGGDVSRAEVLRLINWTLSEPPDRAYFIQPHKTHHIKTAEEFPNGHLDLGLAHGIAGPLAAISLSTLQKHDLHNQKIAVERLADALLANRLHCDAQPDWPTVISPGKEVSPARMAWCYGNPGIAHSLMLAGQALDSDELRTMALSAFERIESRPFSAGQLNSPMLCHGFAGVVQIGLRLLAAAPSDRLAQLSASLCEALVDSVEAWIDSGHLKLEDATDNSKHGFLEGAAGILLVLLSIRNCATMSWDRALLLS